MADNSVSWCRSSNMQTIDPNEKLFVFGYSCKIFRDDEKAKYIDQGKHLIPWMGDESIMIDRYDVRGYLHDLKQYEPTPDAQFEQPDSEEEKLCNEERYRSLRSDVSEEQLYQEEELKRLRAAIAGDGAYHEIGFSYDNEVEKVEPVSVKVEEPEEEPYEPPSGIEIPKGMEVPFNMKIHAIIEKTALFVSEQGGQMEIIIKMKQQNNPQFAFMHLDNPLYPYYKYLVKEIKSGSYKPVQAKKVSKSEDEDEDGHYLHPSLLSGKKENVPKFTVPSINFRRSQDDSYSVLVRNLQQQLAEEKLAREQIKEEENTTADNQQLVNYSLEESGTESMNNSYVSITIPPTEIQPIIQKMAEYVAKNGEDFEYVVKSKNDKRFEFLEESSEYYAYYIKLRNDAKAKFYPPPPSVNEDTAVTIKEDSSSVCQTHSEEPAMQADNYTLPPQEYKNASAKEPIVDEFDALYTQDSQDAVFGPEPQGSEIPSDDLSNSLDSVDSVGLPKGSKTKTSKVLKGPISFSLKAKDTDSVPSEKLKIPLLLDDSDEENTEEGSKEKGEVEKQKKSTEDTRPIPDSKRDSVEREEKAKLTSEMEAKLAEERMRDKLLAAVRDRLVQQKKEKRLEMERQKREEQLKKDRQLQIEQQRKEKQLQLERKKKAALFLKMLEKRDPALDTIAGRLGAEKKSKSRKRSAENGRVPVTKLHITTSSDMPIAISELKREWSDGSESEESGEEIMITEFCSDPDPVIQTTSGVTPAPEVQKVSEKREHKKKKKRSRSRSRERHSKSYRSRDRRRSRSPKSSKHEKKREKELPAAYALTRSRSRSRSPKRYRQNPSYWNRRR